MVRILMMSAKMATPDLLKVKVIGMKVITSYILSMTSPTKFLTLQFYCGFGHVTKVW